MKKIAYFIFLALLLVSFSSYSQELTEMRQVMTAHDEVMAEMPNLVMLINKLHPKADSTKTGRKYQVAIDSLKSSNKSMMTWMHDFGNRFTADEMLKGKALSEEKQQWVIEEKKSIEVLRKNVNLSIKKAEKLLDN